MATGFFNAHPLLAEEKKPAGAAAAAEDDQDSHRNWIELSVGGFNVNGDRAQFQQRYRMYGDVFGGIEDLHMERDIGKKGLLTIDGRALLETHDYLAKIELSNPDVGFLRFGYRNYRTWYDGSGGYYPNSALSGGGLSLAPNNEFLAIDRGEFSAEGGLRLPDFPEITFSYIHQFRKGDKDSTSWGDTTSTGITESTNTTRNIVPSFLDINERRDIYSLDIKHTFGETDFGLGLRYESMTNKDSENSLRRPGESSERYLTTKEEIKTDLFNVHASTETRHGENLWFTTGYSYTRMEENTSGSRIYGSTYDAVYDPLFSRRQARDEGYYDLAAATRYDQHVANVNLMWIPQDHLSIISAFRFENETLLSSASAIETNVVSTTVTQNKKRVTVLNSTQDEFLGLSQKNYWNANESLELRYTGIPNLLIYARGEWTQEEGNLLESEYTGTERTLGLYRDTDNTLLTQKYMLGLNWYPLRRVNIAAQYYHKNRANDYKFNLDSTSNATTSSDRYPAYLSSQDFDTDDFNVRLTWHPFGNLTLVSRYDFQTSTINTLGENLSTVESARSTTHIFSQGVTWTPFDRLSIQGNIHYVLDETTTPASSISKSILDAKNDYWNADVSVILALNDRTSLQASYYYYRANNYQNNSLDGQPYGAGAEEHAATVTFSRQITKNIRWNLKYGYYVSRDETSGGLNNYDAHLVYTSFQFRF
jgi:hypothetical protein